MGRRVRDVMTQEVVTVNEHASFKDVAMLIAERRVSAVPVLDQEGRVLGIVSEADLVLKEEYPEGPPERRLFQGRRRRIAQAKAAGDTAAELMTAPAVTIGPDASVPRRPGCCTAMGSSGCRWSTRPVPCSASSAAPTCSRSSSARIPTSPGKSASRCSCGPCG